VVNLALQGKQVRLNNLWTIGVEIGSGGFGKVHVATANGEECVCRKGAVRGKITALEVVYEDYNPKGLTPDFDLMKR